MDNTSVETLLRLNSENMKEFVKLLVLPLQTKLAQLRSENEELKRSLEFSQNDLEDIKSSIREQGTKLVRLETAPSRFDSAEDRIRSLEDYSRRNNIVVDGVSEMRNETNDQLHVSIRKLFSERLKVEPNIVSIHRLRPRENPEKVPERPRAVLVKLSSFEEKMECVRAAPRLKGTNVYINEDVSRETLNIRREKLDELREKRRKGYI